tara:strand:+ start:1192 stop:1557 length:366 start_codon:yes stop_codon:yes gene_type:complete
MMKKVRAIFILAVVMVLTACGTIQQSQVALEESAVIIVKSKSLVGKTLLTSTRSILIQKDDLTPYRMGVGGVKDRADENLEVMSLVVEPGTHNIELIESNKTLFKTSIYVGSGQTREILIR